MPEYIMKHVTHFNKDGLPNMKIKENRVLFGLQIN